MAAASGGVEPDAGLHPGRCLTGRRDERDTDRSIVGAARDDHDPTPALGHRGVDLNLEAESVDKEPQCGVLVADGDAHDADSADQRRVSGWRVGVVVGAGEERWALLIVRDLLVRPRRFTDLREGLPGIPTNVLSARLKELEDAAVVERRLLPPPKRAVVYALTANGRTLNDAVLGLARWGATRLGDPRPGEVVTADSLVMALRATFHPDAAADVTATWEIHVGDTVLHAVVDHGQLHADVGASPHPPDLIIAGTKTEPPPLKALMNREMTPKGAIADRAVRLTGKTRLLSTFTDIFRIR